MHTPHKVDQVVCLCVNDGHVMRCWKEWMQMKSEKEFLQGEENNKNMNTTPFMEPSGSKFTKLTKKFWQHLNAVGSAVWAKMTSCFVMLF